MGENISVIIRLKSVSICRVYLCPKNCTVCGETNDGHWSAVWGGRIGEKWVAVGRSWPNQGQQAQGYHGPSRASVWPIYRSSFFWLQSLTFSNQQICLAGQIGWLHDSVQNLNFWYMKKISWTLTDPKCKKRRQKQFLRNVSMGKIIRQEQEGAIARTFGQCQQLGNDGNY